MLISFVLSVLFALPCVANPQPMQELMVDEHGQINVPGVLATTAQLATNEAAIIVAEAKVSAAAAAAQEGTNLVAEVLDRIMANELVVYRHGFADSFAAAVLLTENDKLVITEFRPHIEVDRAGRVKHSITYACTVDVDEVSPVVYECNSLIAGDAAALPSSDVGTPQRVSGSYTSASGDVLENVYTVDFWTQPAGQAFYVIYLAGSTPDGDGSVFEITGGIQGGRTATIEWGGNRLSFRGGLLVDVEVLND